MYSQRSLDPSTQVGCAIVTQNNIPISYGYNGPPRGIELTTEQWNNRAEKYMWVEHGERNAIFNALNTTTNVKGSKMYSTAPSCPECARAIVQSGIKDLFVLNSTFNIWMTSTDWQERLKVSMKIFEKGGVNFQTLDTPIRGEFKFRISGKIYTIKDNSIYEHKN